MTPDHTLAVDCNVRDSRITHSQYAARRVKDAICDQFVDRMGRRPSVDVERPMVGLNLHIYRDDAVLSLDSSGDSLHKRGYRPVLTKAPLNEALAAGLILSTGWTGKTPLVDPMCGSGSLPIEAAWLALRRPPGLTRKHFGFMGWMDFDIGLWTMMRDEARRRVSTKLPASIGGSDIRADAIEHARANARAAGIGNLLTFERTDLKDFRPPDGPPGVVICNPPYGERIGDERELRPLYRQMGEVFSGRCRGWACYVFTSNQAPWREIQMKPAAVTPFWNGKIACRLLRYNPT
jgi:putative N6-adenine-specific DNA methylase